MTSPRVLILHAPGTNRDRDAAMAVQVAGGSPNIVLMKQALEPSFPWLDYQMIVIPGGFSYGDDLGAGRIWAHTLRTQLQETLTQFVDKGRPILGICNGFQVLVKAGLLPALPTAVSPEPQATLTFNHSGHFECRWVWIEADPLSPCVFTQGEALRMYCPVAHGEGRFVVANTRVGECLQQGHQLALRYVQVDGQPVTYPANPNGSWQDVAGVCNPAGNVLGLMPHPEDHIFPQQHPQFHRGISTGSGLVLFKRGLAYAAQL